MKKNTIIRLAIFFAIIVVWFGYRYSPFMWVRSNPEIEGLIEQLASKNETPQVERDPIYGARNFLKDPESWKAEYQITVSDAYYKLKAKGKKAFPHLIKSLDDQRYSHHIEFCSYREITVGNACQSILIELLDAAGMRYKGRDSPDGFVSGKYNIIDDYVYSNYGSYAAWWRAEKSLSLREMRVRLVKYRIYCERDIGFVSKKQEKSIMKDLDEAIERVNNREETLPDEVPDDFMVDVLADSYYHYDRDTIAAARKKLNHQQDIKRESEDNLPHN